VKESIRLYQRALQKRSAISDVLEVLRAESVDCAFNKESCAYQARTKLFQWRLHRVERYSGNGDQDYSKACLYKKCVPTSKICTHDHLLAPKAGILYVPDTNDIKIVRQL
jgi:hypothetical protein